MGLFTLMRVPLWKYPLNIKQTTSAASVWNPVLCFLMQHYQSGMAVLGFVHLYSWRGEA